MIKDCWLNLPVAEISRTIAFFSHLGFSFNPRFSEKDHCAGLIVGQKQFIVMLFEEDTFVGFTKNPVSDAQLGTEVLVSFNVSSKEAVDEMARLAVEAGGTTNHRPTEFTETMYGCVFTDLDGHKWNVMYMPGMA